MPTEPPSPGDRRLTRRGLSAAGLGLLAAAGCRASQGETPAASPAASPSTAEPVGSEQLALIPVPAVGDHQAGIVTPPVPQSNCLVATYRLPVRAFQNGWLAELGDLIVALSTGEHPRLPDVNDLTITIGLGPRLAGEHLSVQVDPLPRFAREDLAENMRQGDLFVQICATEIAHLVIATEAVNRLVEAAEGALLWSQTAARGPQTSDGIARTIIGFQDGIVVPRGDDELAESVWTSDNDPAPTGGSFVVVRRLVIDLPKFADQSVAEQEAVIGRERDSGAPLGGGQMRDEVNLAAKSTSGDYVIPLHAHARAAHPLATGRPLMLRRSYSFFGADGVGGVLFICYQRDPESFIQTQLQLDQTDALMEYTTCTASGIYYVLPGYSAGSALGSVE